MNEKPPVNSGWSTPQEAAPNDSQETSVLDAVTPPKPGNQESISGGDGQREYDRWTSAYTDNSADAVNDPASRFISALEDQPTAADPEGATDSVEADAGTTTDPTSTWVTPPASGFKASNQQNWSYQAVPEQQSDSADIPGDSNAIDSWRAPSTWNQTPTTSEPEEDASEADEPAELEPAEIASERDDQAAKPTEPEPVQAEQTTGPTGGQAWKPSEDRTELDGSDDDDSDFEEETDAAGFHDGRDEVDYLSGDENIATSGTEPAKLEPNDARVRAIELVDELRRMVRMMPGGVEQDRGAAAMALTEASLNIGDFDDLRDVITELQEDPRDIQALSNLARKADKIEQILDEHASLQAAIETALKELNG